jgi:DNA-directed RNA polymerase subunit RPC12/RpoP
MSARQFRDFKAASLYCSACGEARPVREKLLLILPEKELYEYLCATCGTSVGQREISAAEQVMRRESARTPRGPQVRIL